MSPPSATVTLSETQRREPAYLASKMGVLHLNGSDVSVNKTKPDEVVEDYSGKYQFAPIEEADVSRAMIKRYVVLIE